MKINAKTSFGRDMERHCRTRSLRSRETLPPKNRVAKPAIQKPLCRLCECPTSDGHVLASHVDRFKLRKWAMEVMNLTEEDENLPDVVEEDALICYFCIWQAEFGDESGDEAVAWWPKNLDLEVNAKVLRENYSVGEVEQCWVQLDEIVLVKYEKKIPKRKYGSEVCLYCGNSYNKLMDHVKKKHKEAIKCGIQGCTTYFHTEEEKEQHMQHDFHEKGEKPCETRNFWCKFCKIGKLYSKVNSWRKHMRRKHPKQVACTHYGCKEYFKSKYEMIVHSNSLHKNGIKKNLLQCEHCEYFTTEKSKLSKHQQAKHFPKKFKCDNCDARFGSKYLVSIHYKQCHTFDVCISCGHDVALGLKRQHRRPMACTKCKLRFKCLGLYQLHRNKCKQALSSCKECGKSFNACWMLNRHVKRFHSKTSNLLCDHCDYSSFYKFDMGRHIQRNHFPKTIKCEDCNKLFGSRSVLKNHKYKKHEYVRCAECSQEMSRQAMSSHRTIKTCRRCKCKLNCSGLLETHVCPQGNFFYCDKCSKIYKEKNSLYSHFVKKHIDV